MLSLEKATVDDLESLAQLYEELSGEETDIYKMQENFKLMESNPNYIVLTAKEDNLVVGPVMGIVCYQRFSFYHSQTIDFTSICTNFKSVSNSGFYKAFVRLLFLTKILCRYGFDAMIGSYNVKS